MASRSTKGRMGRAARTVGAIAIGAAAGSIVALLCTPRSGRAMRQLIRQRMRTLRRNATRRVGETQRVLAREAEALRDATASGLVEARDWVNGQLAISNGHSRKNGQTRRPTRRHAVRHA